MTENVNISSIKNISPPHIIKEQFPITYSMEQDIKKWRKDIKKVVSGNDKRLLAIVGPCSIHDYDVAIEYAKQLKKIADKYKDQILIVMRVYFEKPRTTVGWKGLINDPHLDGTYKINEGILLARRILIEITKIGLPIGCEFLDVFLPQYYADLVSWGAIGARTTESQQHRQLASGLSMPIGFKNGTGGSIDIAADALISASHPHTFLGINDLGYAARFSTKGNQDVHIILRGSKREPNYYPEKILETLNILEKKSLPKRVMVDMSHGNSRKIHMNQLLVGESICSQIKNGNDCIMGVMIESNLNEGNQKLVAKSKLKWGISITDSCIDIDTTDKLLNEIAKVVRTRFIKEANTDNYNYYNRSIL